MSNADLVLNAERIRRTRLLETLEKRAVTTADFAALSRIYGPWSTQLKRVSDHITVPREQVDQASDKYAEVGNSLLRALDWPEDVIEIHPQGSASTQTLIRYPDRAKFDIDAVCAVDVNRIDARDPEAFFYKVGEALSPYAPTAKKRCWSIDMPGQPYYLEFTPSIPLATVSERTLNLMSPRYFPVREYEDTALAVVDMPTRSWKTSNPRGVTTWVDRAASRPLVLPTVIEFATLQVRAGVSDVPAQDIEITDTLRTAIRLFKRHRDMCVRRGFFEREFKPISVIIVTLLTRCYDGLASVGRRYNHPLMLLVDLADLLPYMVPLHDGDYHVDNPTVEGENFAEKWNGDGGERYKAFSLWCDVLRADLQTILAETDESGIRRAVDRVFGCTAAKAVDTEFPEQNQSVSRRPPPPPPRTRGLA
jgi:hypothetical protein